MPSAAPSADVTATRARLLAVRDEIGEFCDRYDRDPAEVRLLAVSKTKPLAAIDAAASGGQQDFGENYLQEAVAKVEARPDLTWHFIGAIQSNKTRVIARHFDWVHTVASRKVADRLSSARSAEQAPIEVCVQVNISADPAKAGVAASETMALLKHVSTLPNLHLRGLMTLPAKAEGLVAHREPFARLRHAAESARAAGFGTVTELSMGMSRDLEAAIAEGATWVRIGTAIFGAREPGFSAQLSNSA